MKYWKKLPAWFRKVLLEVVETGLLSALIYVISVKSGGEAVDIQMLQIVACKAILKLLRSHPEIPVDDYINNQK